MKIFCPETVHNLLFEINIQSAQDQQNTLPLRELADLCLSHENLRHVVKQLLGECMIKGCDNKELVNLAQRIVK